MYPFSHLRYESLINIHTYINIAPCERRRIQDYTTQMVEINSQQQVVAGGDQNNLKLHLAEMINTLFQTHDRQKKEEIE